MAGSAAEQPPTHADDADTDWSATARLWRRMLVFVAHWRLRIVCAWRLVADSVRRGVRYAIRSPGRTRPTAPARDSLLPAVADFDVLPVPIEGRDDDRSASTQRPLPSARDTERGLPASRAALQVERTADCLTISDPATDEAYLSSTHWVDVEE